MTILFLSPRGNSVNATFQFTLNNLGLEEQCKLIWYYEKFRKFSDSQGIWFNNFKQNQIKITRWYWGTFWLSRFGERRLWRKLRSAETLYEWSRIAVFLCRVMLMTVWIDDDTDKVANSWYLADDKCVHDFVHFTGPLIIPGKNIRRQYMEWKFVVSITEANINFFLSVAVFFHIYFSKKNSSM